MFLMAYASGSEYKQLNNVDNKSAQKGLEDKITEVKKFQADAAAQVAALEAAQKRLEIIGAGVKERLNWQLLHQFVNMVTPQPNGGHLVDMSAENVEVKKKYWAGDGTGEKDKTGQKKQWKQAQEAFHLLEEKKYNPNKKSTPEESQKRDQFIKENLIQMNIVGVNAMYGDDLSSYFLKRMSARRRSSA